MKMFYFTLLQFLVRYKKCHVENQEDKILVVEKYFILKTVTYTHEKIHIANDITTKCV